MAHSAMAKSKTRTMRAELSSITSEVSGGALTVMGTASALVGLWAVACFVAAMVQSGGPISLVKDWISAVTGI
ncbi:MAG: hypothetical protein ACOY3Z_08215 [Thermodesulfobacteriota bacterium]